MASSLAKPQLYRPEPTSGPASPSSKVKAHPKLALNAQHANSNRPPITGLRPRSPNENTPMNSYFSTRAIPLEKKKSLSPETTRRSSAFYPGPSSKNGYTDPDANFNRWSQSTTSSKRSSVQLQSHSTFTKRLSGPVGHLSGHSSPTVQSFTGRTNKRPRSPPPIPALAARVSPTSEHPPPLLPPIVTLSSLSRAVDAADSPSSMSAHTPATADLLSSAQDGSSAHDYFGDQWSSASSKNATSKSRSSRHAHRPSPLSPNAVQTKIPESVYSPRATTFQKHQDRRHSGHRRRRTSSIKSNVTTEGESSASDHRDMARRNRRRRAPSQKALLSKALAKANHAVVLDGKQNVEGAILAYGDACNLLRQVMVRSSGEDDRRKLEAVRNTYKTRIGELQASDPFFTAVDNKALPARPPERDSAQTDLTIVTDEEEGDVGEPPKSVPTGHDSGYGSGRYKYNQPTDSPPQIPPRRQSLHTSTFHSEAQDLGVLYEKNFRNGNLGYQLQPPYADDVPPPLTPRRGVSPNPPVERQAVVDEDMEDSKEMNEQHTSWLNTINESDGSSQSSVHSRRSSVGLRRRQIRPASGATEAEFDAALDAAIEVAYDDGFEPDDEAEDDLDSMVEISKVKTTPRRFSAIKRNIELAKENVREVEREAAISQAKKREKDRLQSSPNRRESLDHDSMDEGEEEERMLEEMTRDFILDEAAFDVQTKSALPRQSGSSGFSGRTWGSSLASNPTTAGTSLSPVSEGRTLPSLASQMAEQQVPPLMHPPPSGALPPPPGAPPQSTIPTDAASQDSSFKRSSFTKRAPSPSVRERRLSGMKAKELKIETNNKPYAIVSQAPKTQPPPIPPSMVPPQAIPEAPQSALGTEQFVQSPPSPIIREEPPSSVSMPLSRKASFPLTGSDAGEPISSTASALTKVTSADSDTLATSMPNSPARFTAKPVTGLRKNFSSSSLRSKSFTASADHDTSPNTSVSSMSSLPRVRRVPSPAVPVLPTPIESSFLPRGQPIGGAYLFESDIHSPISPGSPNPLASNAPLALEPCPENVLLRPFWFLRTVYQTIAHPRGGYITNRLFVPRDIWRVKNIKLKNVEEKVSTCDLLTAALLKLSKVDTFSADAVLEEMQFLENVMERAQANLSKKLGNEVGVQGALAAFKGVNIVDESASEAVTTNALNGNKSYLKGWRKLRSKNSLGPHASAVNLLSSSRPDLKDTPTMNSLPMSNAQNPRFPKRDISQVQCVGPNPSYMGALARLCDAAQILDQIARQVEDPGLKHSSPTHVGLELCTRHAAEFFGFYICRFVQADISLMLDKFIKRSSEWVLT